MKHVTNNIGAKIFTGALFITLTVATVSIVFFLITFTLAFVGSIFNFIILILLFICSSFAVGNYMFHRWTNTTGDE